ncbi:hypothetical protein [Allosphingosinicella deserti]|uniref:hypothetical protein n=1 Tax=Allosphingosinicella deserti TaxID=2116704 RepID=UPI0013049166|nr:hypothetical protein [Sphingomonas deserti]
MKIAIALLILAVMILPAMARIRIKLDRGRRSPRTADADHAPQILPARAKAEDAEPRP